jgi:hypothetical protein
MLDFRQDKDQPRTLCGFISASVRTSLAFWDFAKPNAHLILGNNTNII